MAHRYFLSTLKENTAVVTGDEAKHLVKVMRIQPGDNVILCDKDGFDYEAKAVTIQEKEIVFDILSKQLNPAQPTVNLTVYMALPKSDKLEFITQKMCELGACYLVPFVSEFCVAQKSKKEDNKKQRLQKIATEACKQSGQSRPMQVLDTLTYKQFLGQISSHDLVLFFYEHGTENLKDMRFGGAKNVAIVIGSEGGFSQQEAQLAAQNGAHIIGLGPRILRCETAAVTAASLAMFCLDQI